MDLVAAGPASQALPSRPSIWGLLLLRPFLRLFLGLLPRNCLRLAARSCGRGRRLCLIRRHRMGRNFPIVHRPSLPSGPQILLLLWLEWSPRMFLHRRLPFLKRDIGWRRSILGNQRRSSGRSTVGRRHRFRCWRILGSRLRWRRPWSCFTGRVLWRRGLAYQRRLRLGGPTGGGRRRCRPCFISGLTLCRRVLRHRRRLRLSRPPGRRRRRLSAGRAVRRRVLGYERRLRLRGPARCGRRQWLLMCHLGSCCNSRSANLWRGRGLSTHSGLWSRSDRRVRDHLCPCDLLRRDVHCLACHGLSATEDCRRYGGCGHVPVHIINAAHIRHICYVRDVGDISHVSDIDLTQIRRTVVVPWHKGLSRSQGEPGCGARTPEAKAEGEAGSTHKRHQRR